MSILTIICFIGAGAIFWYSFSAVSDLGKRFDAVRDQLKQTEQYQQSIDKRLDKIQTGIGNSADRVGASAERITAIERRIDTSQAGLEESQRIISDCQQIIGRVKEGRSK